MESYNSNNDKPKISLNRKKRMWNRYRNYIAGLAVLVVAVIIFAIVLKSCSNKNSGRQDDTKATTPSVQQESTAPVIQNLRSLGECNRADNSSCCRQDFICFRYTRGGGLYIFISIQQGRIYW
ncbi:MAG: hypothetical protein ACLS9K_04570 [Lachnospira eligens]